MWRRAVIRFVSSSAQVLRPIARRVHVERAQNEPPIPSPQRDSNTIDSGNIPSTSCKGTRSLYENHSNESDIFFDEDADLDIVAEQVVQALRKIDKENAIADSGLVRDPSNEPDISQMGTGEETASRPVNRFRQIIYNEGELDRSDFTKPPSPENPHPFDPSSTLPPTHARSLAVYVNHLPVLQRLIDLGMDLLEVEITTNIGRNLVRLDWTRDVKPRVFWLVKQVGVPAADLGSYLTRNPYFLTQSLDDMKARVQYLYSKNFTKSAIAKIVFASRYWLNNDVKIIDGRLGFLQRQFRLRGSDVRELITKEPRIIAFGVGPIQRILILLNKEFGFTPNQTRQMLLADPRLFMNADSNTVPVQYNYLTKVMQLPLEHIAACPLALRCPVAYLRRRHEFLHRVGRAQYNPNVPDYVALADVIHPSDRYFAEHVAYARPEDYDRFLKLL